ncbi:MAG: hypothetical protein ACT4O9_03885 [Blastocatellia bacterium]
MFVSVLTLAQPEKHLSFREFLESRLASYSASGDKRIILSDICEVDSDQLAMRVFKDYGSVFAADRSVIIPLRCIFKSEADVEAFQNNLRAKSVVINRINIELQEAATIALMKAIDEAKSNGDRITPLDGSIAGGRSFSDTVMVWNSRFLPALEHWVRRRRISRTDADAVRKMKIPDQVRKVLEWERSGLYFSTNFSRPIFSSVAPPGASQHLSLLAFDVVEYGNHRVKIILNKHGWFQTVIDDAPHLT